MIDVSDVSLFIVSIYIIKRERIWYIDHRKVKVIERGVEFPRHHRHQRHHLVFGPTS